MFLLSQNGGLSSTFIMQSSIPMPSRSLAMLSWILFLVLTSGEDLSLIFSLLAISCRIFFYFLFLIFIYFLEKLPQNRAPFLSLHWDPKLLASSFPWWFMVETPPFSTLRLMASLEFPIKWKIPSIQKGLALPKQVLVNPRQGPLQCINEPHLAPVSLYCRFIHMQRSSNGAS